MKQDDIRKSVLHALEMELQRSIINCAAFMDEMQISEIFGKTMDDIFGESEIQPE